MDRYIKICNHCGRENNQPHTAWCTVVLKWKELNPDFYYHKGASISEDEQYRYWLSRDWADEGARVTFIMLNPSTADSNKDDATVKKCVRLAKSWGYRGLFITNLYDFRSVNPLELWKTPNPISPDFFRYFNNIINHHSHKLIAAWGCSNKSVARGKEIYKHITTYGENAHELYALRLSDEGLPWHPLYLPDDTQPFLWRTNDNMS